MACEKPRARVPKSNIFLHLRGSPTGGDTGPTGCEPEEPAGPPSVPRGPRSRTHGAQTGRHGRAAVNFRERTPRPQPPAAGPVGVTP